MTGTIDLSIEQLQAIVADATDDAWVFRPTRVVIHPVVNRRDMRAAVRVETYRVGDDVTVGTRYVLRDGSVLTRREYEERIA